MGFASGLFLAYVGDAGSSQQAEADNPALAMPVPAGAVRGTVLETMNSGGYTYVYVETDKDKRWIAARQTAVKVGDVVQSQEGMPMSDFTSQTLDRSFDIVYFVDAIFNLSSPAQPGGHPGGPLPQGHPGGAMPEGHPSNGMPEGHPSVAGTASGGAAPSAKPTDITVASVESGQDIAYVHANRESLAGQTISLRGKVVKYNDGIMGRNWIHIRDGSGDSADGSNDLTVTSSEATAVGETVVVTGKVIVDKDFGAGYSFPVMMEEAKISAE
jgi:hypothetical protein